MKPPVQFRRWIGIDTFEVIAGEPADRIGFVRLDTDSGNWVARWPGNEKMGPYIRRFPYRQSAAAWLRLINERGNASE